MSDFDLWGGSFGNDINRVLADDLSTILSPKGISAAPWRARVPNTHTVSVSITTFEAAGGEVTLKAQWSIAGKEDSSTALFRESVIVKPVPGGSYADIVGAMSEALADLGRQMAAEIEGFVKRTQTERKA
jgi:uncharacterized lipoprotein YmbA